MKHTIVVILLLSCVCLSVTSKGQQIFSGLQGQELLDQVAKHYTPAFTLTYGEARDTMYSKIYNIHDSITCVYSGHQLYLPKGEDPSTYLHKDGDHDGINTEHTWPQSKGARYGLAKTDMHHLFPTRIGVNAARQNFPFAEIPDHQTTSWFHMNGIQHTMPQENIDRYSEQYQSHFEPQEAHKGNVARAMFYFYTIYREEADDQDPEFFILQRETLCSWHAADPADSLEQQRNLLIAAYQDDKINPFVSDCSLAARSYCQDFASGCADMTTSASSEIAQANELILNNPVTDYLNLSTDYTGSEYLIADQAGRLVQSQRVHQEKKIEVTNLPSGMYYITLWSEGKHLSQRFIKL